MHAQNRPTSASKSQRKPQPSIRSFTSLRKIKSQSKQKHAPPLTTPHRGMSAKKLTVILNKDFEELGKAGDLVALKPGRARNHLIPKGIVSYDTLENRAALSARGVKITNIVIDKEEELKAAATRPYSIVLGDVVRNIRWNFTRHTVSSADNHIAVPITARDIVMRLRKSKFHFVTEQDVALTPGYEETGLNHCGIYPVAVALHCIDQSDWAIFNVTINRAESKQKLEASGTTNDV